MRPSLTSHPAPPAIASKSAPAAPTKPVVVIERQEFVDLIARYEYLIEQEESLTQIVEAQRKRLDAFRFELDEKDRIIEQLQEQLADSQAQLALVNEEREKLESKAKSDDLWDTVKNYLLLFLGGIAAAAVLL